ncbi:MAG: acetyl-CoA C-acetyltransferase [Bordetella sp.]|jgi:acetyl-CoA C-acetyltransferase
MSQSPRAVYLVDGMRTPFLKAKGTPGPFAASDLAAAAAQALMLRQPFAAKDFSEVILGCAAPAAEEANIGRIVSLRIGCGEKVPAFTVMRNCASGLQAIDSAMLNIQIGRSELVLAGGVDALSRTPLLYADAMVRWFSAMGQKKTPMQKLGHFTRLPMVAMFAPVISILKGLTDPVVGLSMGQTAENLAHRFGITRQDMDLFASRSHVRAACAQEQGRFANELAPLIDSKGTVYDRDDGVRADSNLEGLAKLRPVFDKPYGNVTAGNSSQVTDGAAWVILASEQAVKDHGLTPLARLVDLQWAGLDPAQMGLGPIHAATPLLQRHKLKMHDINLWEINEAFAAQVIGCLRAWQDTSYAKEQLGLSGPMPGLDEEKLNVNGGAIAIGHPVGASGARILLHLANAMKARGEKKGLASICIGGGQGGAALLEGCV